MTVLILLQLEQPLRRSLFPTSSIRGCSLNPSLAGTTSPTGTKLINDSGKPVLILLQLEQPLRQREQKLYREFDYSLNPSLAGTTSPTDDSISISNLRLSLNPSLAGTTSPTPQRARSERKSWVLILLQLEQPLRPMGVVILTKPLIVLILLQLEQPLRLLLLYCLKQCNVCLNPSLAGTTSPTY